MSMMKYCFNKVKGCVYWTGFLYFSWTFSILSAHSFCRAHANVFFCSVDIFLGWLIKVQTSYNDEWRLVTARDNKWWQILTIYSEWQRVVISIKALFCWCLYKNKKVISHYIRYRKWSKINNVLRQGFDTI